MRVAIAAFVGWLLIAGSASAQFGPSSNQPQPGLGAAPNAASAYAQLGQNAAPAPPCVQASVFFARFSPPPSPLMQSIYGQLICGSIADGTWGKLYIFYLFATDNATLANANLISTQFPFAPNGGMTFAAYKGYTGNASSGFADSGFKPSDNVIPYTQNSASFGAYITLSRTAGHDWVSLGVFSTNQIGLLPKFTDNLVYFRINDLTWSTAASSDAAGLWIASRTAANSKILYKNGVSFISAATASTGLPAANLFWSAMNNAGTATEFSGDQHSVMFVGTGLTAGDVTALSARINTAMQALGLNAY